MRLRWALCVRLKLYPRLYIIIKIVENKDVKINHLPQGLQKSISPSFPPHRRGFQLPEVDLF